MPEEIILHIGPHKTGTTAIQSMLTETRDELAAQSYFYPTFGFSEYGHHEIAHHLFAARRAEFDSICSHISEIDGTVILSSENFSLLTISMIEALRNRLSANRYRIVYYLRNFLCVLYSWWQEKVKHGHTGSFMSFAAEAAIKPYSFHLFSASETLKRYASVFGDSAVEVHLYDEIVGRQSSVVPHFFSEIILAAHIYQKNRERGKQLGSTNKSFGPVSSEIIRVLNTRGVRGIDVFLSSSELKKCALEIERGSGKHDFMGEWTVSYDDHFFRALELTMLREHGDKICFYNNYPVPTMLFSKRRNTMRYVGSDFWLWAYWEKGDIYQLGRLIEEVSGRESS